MSDLSCSIGRATRAMAFSILADLSLVTLFVMYCLHVFSFGVTGPVIGNTVIGTAIAVFFFSSISLGLLGGTCIDILQEPGIVFGGTEVAVRATYAYTTSIRSMLFSFFVLILVFVGKVFYKRTVFFRKEQFEQREAAINELQANMTTAPHSGYNSPVPNIPYNGMSPPPTAHTQKTFMELFASPATDHEGSLPPGLNSPQLVLPQSYGQPNQEPPQQPAPVPQPGANPQQ